MTRRQAAGWLLCGALAVHVPIAVTAARHNTRHQADFDNYYRIGTRPGRPYVDFAVEFPVGTVAALRTIAPLANTRDRFGVVLVATNVLADAVIVAGLLWGWGIEAAASYALVAAPVLDLFLLRLDLWSTMFATLGVAAWKRERGAWAALALTAGAAFKLWPLAFLPLLLIPTQPRSRVARSLLAAAAANAALLVAWLRIDGANGLLQVLTFRGASGWEVESTVGAVWTMLDRSTLRLESGAWRIGSMNGLVSILLFALGGLLGAWLIWRGARSGHVGSGWAGGISALLACSALLSPQFACWIAPASGIAWEERDTRLAILTALVVFCSNLAFKSFVPLLRGEPGALALVLVRNALLIVLAIAAARVVASRS